MIIKLEKRLDVGVYISVVLPDYVVEQTGGSEAEACVGVTGTQHP